jgi:hypothetical protein
MAAPLGSGVDSRPEYGLCVYPICGLQRLAKIARRGNGGNWGRVFLTCRESKPNNAHNVSFVWRDDWYKNTLKKPLLPVDQAWEDESNAQAAALIEQAEKQAEQNAQMQAAAAAAAAAAAVPASQQLTQVLPASWRGQQ